MTSAETKLLVARIVRRWPHSDIPPVDQYVEDLAHAQPAHAQAAIDAMYRDGEKFAPNGGQIIRWIAEAAIDAPSWGKVKAEIDRRRAAAGGARWAHDGRVCPLDRCDGRGLVIDETTRTASYCECREQMKLEMAAAGTSHPLVLMFILEVGRAEIAALDGDRIAEAQVRAKYEAFVADFRRGIAYEGIDTAGLPALERLQHERAQRAGLLGAGRSPRRLDAASVVDSKEGA